MAHKRVLCVDDHPAGLRTMAKVLEHSGFEVVAVADPNSIPNIAESTEFDAVVLDFQLPGSNGVFIAQSLKQRDPSIPIVLITAYPADVPENAANWIDAFLCKGHKTAKELPEVIVALISGKKKLSREETLKTLRQAAHEALEMDQQFAARFQPADRS
jgi:CheY-like chemotaxis protein